MDETSFQKRREYVTVVTDPATGKVLHVEDGNLTQSLEAFYTKLNSDQKQAITGVSMDMWPAFISATQRHMGNRELLKAGSTVLKNTKYVWLKRPENLTERQ